MEDDRVWTRARAEAEGISRDRLTGGVEFVKVAHGRYVEAVWAADLKARCAAALSVVEGGCISHWTALALHGLPVPLDLPPEPHVLVLTGMSVPKDAAIIGHHAARVPTYLIEGLPATGAVRSWCDATALSGEVYDLVAAGDALCVGGQRPSATSGSY